ncbi:MAG: serine protease [Clostridia bacterium]|nr:serine protease [Clostridia bacterium]
MKKFKIFILTMLLIPVFLFSGCSFGKPYIIDIQKTQSFGKTDTYTLTYSDGTNDTITVENGKDGENVDIEELFASLVSRGFYENTNAGFQQFVKDYFSVDVEYDNIQASVNKALQSAVVIYAAYPVNYLRTSFSISCGAGVIYKTDGDTSYIVTNYHVVYAKNSTTANKISNDIVLYQYGVTETISTSNSDDNGHFGSYDFGKGSVSCQYIGGSLNYDIAVLKVSTSDLVENNATYAPVTVADSYSVADTAIAIGNPEGEGTSVTKGIISVESEYLAMKGADDYTDCVFRVMRIDTPINGGNSGGGLFNNKGELIGIVNAKGLTSSSGHVLDNYCYALPIDNVTKVADNIISNYSGTAVKPVRLSFGIVFTAQNGKAVYDQTYGTTTITDELVVTEVKNNTLAKTYGIEEDDVITSIKINDNDAYTLRRAFEFKDLMLTVKPGDNLLINIKKPDNSTKTITIYNLSSAYFEEIA